MAADLLHTLAFSALGSAAAILCVFALRRPMRARFGAAATYALWLLVPIAALTASLPARVVDVAWQRASASSAAGAPATSTPAAAPVRDFDPAPLLAAIWLAGACGMLLALCLQQRRFVRSLGALERIDAELLRAQSNAGCPALIGVLRPRIVLPADFDTRYAAAERALILAHERVHAARGDAPANALVAALRCVQWFNPLVHFAVKRFRFDQEVACDAAVIARFPQARGTYAAAMLKTQLADHGLPAGCHWSSSHPLTERIAMLQRPLPGRARAALGLALATALVGSGGYAAWAAQPPTERLAAPPPVAAGDHAASYGRIARIDYPAGLVLDGDCVGIVTLALDASGKIVNLLALTLHGSAPQQTCSHLVGKATAGMLAQAWTFEPAIAHGQPVPSQVVVPIVFTTAASDPFDATSIPPLALDPIRVSAPAPQAAATAAAQSGHGA